MLGRLRKKEKDKKKDKKKEKKRNVIPNAKSNIKEHYHIDASEIGSYVAPPPEPVKTR